MILLPETESMAEYLKSSDIIDYEHENVSITADELSRETRDEVDLVKSSYEYVRDCIAHSFDIGASTVTCTASEVLTHQHGICYAKAHLLAAILRKLGISTGFCYQRLVLDEHEKPLLVLHGLNAVYLKSVNRWIRIDARGNKESVDAQFSIDEEKLAFPVKIAIGEVDIPMVFANPNRNVIAALKKSRTVDELIHNLPSNL